MKNMCQSCARLLKDKRGGDYRGTEENGQRSDEYCTQCYLRGEFLEPTMTYDQMLSRGLDSFDQVKVNRVTKWIYKKSYPKLLLGLKRWK